ncbi:MarR family winged helix-turn-helix transcriptional regulator [Novosphingobium sp. CF614]|uniref:MarR family winged helix-turn-helix transcriptional regulator n=1 Tax=Novosphingobium sp. CF614 TaxID=1884364 RepID=UPI000B88F0C1|nr:MarR family winged helix-turn-helix transcriptional regulator [Novosphingobium sp. CF614]
MIDETNFDSNSTNSDFLQNGTENLPNLALNQYLLRRKRDDLFKSDIFSDPAWDILLDIYISEKAGKAASVASTCAAARVPVSTGSRWITILVQNGYVARLDDPANAESALLSLTSTAHQALDTLFPPCEAERT